MRILIAEDDEVLADGLTRAMQQAGYAVDRVGDGSEADAILKGGQPFDLVILDIQLPKLDGFIVLRNLRERNQHVPVIILTARDSVEDRVKGLDLGADDYLSKLFNLQELEAILRTDSSLPITPPPRQRNYLQLRSYSQLLQGLAPCKWHALTGLRPRFARYP